MNWSETKQVIVNSGFERPLPDEREWGIDLHGANLRGADLHGANLRGANLHDADLHGANLHGANLRGADLYGADLHGADLHGAIMNWDSHDLLAEILRRDSGNLVTRRMLAGLILVSRDWCWNQFLALDIEPESRQWAIDTFQQYVRDGDNAPDILKVQL